ncbi:MAG: OmpA family protein, partial [Thiotrichaceae bacterium]|nr:OmpA family protein [Thiotrichaceae bacterium]
QEAIRLCPSNAYAHNNFANLLGEEKQFAQAISHYKLALQYKPDLSEAWYGLGEAYYAQKRFPLSLDAYLHACTKDSDAKQRVIKLLENNRYAVTEEGEILDKDSLLMLYDKAKRQTIQNNLAACGLRASPKMTITFRNFLFDTAKATLQNDETTQLQLTEVAKALKSLLSVAVIQIDGHSDKQAFKDVSLIESNRLNQALSKQRAEKIKTELEHRGVPSHKIRTHGFGDKKPISKHLHKNRRVEIKVD